MVCLGLMYGPIRWCALGCGLGEVRDWGKICSLGGRKKRVSLGFARWMVVKDPCFFSEGNWFIEVSDGFVRFSRIFRSFQEDPGSGC